MIKSNNKIIVFVIGSMGKGGAERVISILANHYASKSWDVTIVTLLDDKCDYDLLSSIKIITTMNKFTNRILQTPIWIYKLRKIFFMIKPSVIISFIGRINLLSIISSIGLKSKLIISERNDPQSDGRSFFVKICTYCLYPLANHIIFQTRWAKQCFPNYLYRKSSIISNPIEIFSLKDDSPQKKIVAVGRLISQKNHNLLIDAFSEVVKKYPNYMLFIFGEGHLRNELTDQIRRLNLESCVFLPGKCDNVHKEIADAKMFVLSSNYEGLSNALLEAMSMGLPCISSNCAGSNEIIKDYYNGLVFAVNNLSQLVSCMEKLIEDEKLCIRLSISAKESTKYTSKTNILKQWDEIV